MNHPTTFSPSLQRRALWLSTFAMAVCFCIWVIFSIVGLEFRDDMGLSDSQFGLLVATPVLTGSLVRPVLGIWSEMFGAQKIYALLMLVVAGFTFALPWATSYPMLLALGLGLGLAGGSFAIGIVYVSAWYPPERQGVALAIFGAGNIGAAITSFVAPQLLMMMSWQNVTRLYAALALMTAVLLFVFARPAPAPSGSTAARKAPETLAERLTPLKQLKVWRFSTYYFFMFGGFVALSSWLPSYYIGTYGVDLRTAGILAGSFSLPAAVFRVWGGWLADHYGARRMMYISFSSCLVLLFFLSYPSTRYIVDGIRGPIEFTLAPPLLMRAALLFVLGVMMSFGMAAVFKHVPNFFPEHVGAVGGVVGMIGGLGGFFLPIAFGIMNDLVGVWSSCFMLLFGIVLVSLVWMHFSILHKNRQRYPALRSDRDLPEAMTE